MAQRDGHRPHTSGHRAHRPVRLAPVRELQAPVFAFGAAWHTYLEEIPSLRVVTRLEPNDELSHKVTALTDDRGLLIVAMSHRGGAMPPRTASVARLREVIAGRWN